MPPFLPLLALSAVLAAAQSAPGSAPLWCGTTDVVGAFSYAGSAPTHVLGQPAMGYFAAAFSGLYLNGKGLLGLELISALSAVCLTRVEPVPPDATTTPPQGAAFVATVASPHAPTADARGCLFIALSPEDGSGAWPPQSSVLIQYWLRPATPAGDCATSVVRAPDFTVRNATLVAGAAGAQAAAQSITQCPTAPIPPTLTGFPLAPPALDAITNASVLEGFVPGGFVAALLGGLLTTTRCAYSAAPITSYPYSLAYEVVFGSELSGLADSCGWFARGPGLNLTYMLNTPAAPVPLGQAASICPQAWAPGATRVLVDYFDKIPAPPPAAAPSTALSPGAVAGLVVGCAAFVALVVGGAILRSRRAPAQDQAAVAPPTYLRLRLGEPV